MAQSRTPYHYARNNPLIFNDPLGLIENPGFNKDVWRMIEDAWNATPAGGMGHFLFSNGYCTDFAIWGPDGGGGGGGFFISSPGFFTQGTTAESAYLVIRSLAEGSSRPPSSSSGAGGKGPGIQFTVPGIGTVLASVTIFNDGYSFWGEPYENPDWLWDRIYGSRSVSQSNNDPNWFKTGVENPV
jgi:hypothetical protein